MKRNAWVIAVLAVLVLTVAILAVLLAFTGRDISEDTATGWSTYGCSMNVSGVAGFAPSAVDTTMELIDELTQGAPDEIRDAREEVLTALDNSRLDTEPSGVLVAAVARLDLLIKEECS